MKKLLLSALIFFGLAASAQAKNPTFTIVNNTGSAQTNIVCIITGSHAQNIATPAAFALGSGDQKTITGNASDSSYMCNITIGGYSPANTITPSPDVYQLQYSALLNLMTLTKE